MGDGSTFDLDTAEAQALVAALNHEFSDIGQFLAPHPQRWYLSLHEKPLLDTPPLSSVAGRQLHTEQLAAPHHGWLRRLQNEIQMLLHSHPVNQAREATGKPEINGLWLWGSGSSSTAVNTAFDTVWTSNTLARGLGLSQGAKIHPQARCLKDILAHPGSQQNLVVLEDLLSPALYEESTRWRLALENLETLWFAPLADTLSRGQVKAAHLVCSGFHGQLDWVLAPSDRWRFWKRPQALARLTQSLAESHPLPWPNYWNARPPHAANRSLNSCWECGDSSLGVLRHDMKM